MVQTSIFQMQAGLCRAMSHALRLEIVHLLREGPKNVSSLVQLTSRSQAVVSRHLASLRNVGVIVSQRKGQEVYYQIANPKIVRVCDLMRQVLAEQAQHRSDMINAMEDDPKTTDHPPAGAQDEAGEQFGDQS